MKRPNGGKSGKQTNISGIWELPLTPPFTLIKVAPESDIDALLEGCDND